MGGDQGRHRIEVAYGEELRRATSADDLDTRKGPEEGNFCGLKVDEWKIGIEVDGVPKRNRWFVWRSLCCLDESGGADFCIALWGTV